MQIQILPELPTDSKNYDVLTRGVVRAKDVPGLTCEIGLRRGGGSKAIIEGMLESGVKKIHIAIDPFGDMEYADGDVRAVRYGYTNAMRNECLMNLYLYCFTHGINFYFFGLEDTEFFRRFADGVPVYEEQKEIVQDYSFVHFDGPHSVAAVREEVGFFHARTREGAVFVFDDVHLYDHSVIDELLDASGWQLYETSERKWAYFRRGSGPTP